MIEAQYLSILLLDILELQLMVEFLFHLIIHRLC
jgi:hypothetical protein